jgi:NAD(P)-dependent dehydrogenase (short-subunit alcohol dehydrogenase family)
MGSAASNFTSAQNSFSSKSTAEDVTANIDLQGKTILITGATAGIGKETARVLAKRGGHIIIGVRNIQKGEAVKEEILKETPSAPFDVLELDVSSLASVRKFAEDFKSRDFPISILINNAGAIFGKFELSQDGLEKNFATNHMGEAFQTLMFVKVQQSGAQIFSVGPFSPRSLQVLAS